MQATRRAEGLDLINGERTCQVKKYLGNFLSIMAAVGWTLVDLSSTLLVNGPARLASSRMFSPGELSAFQILFCE